ncbi:hypothetical protein Tbd_1337 [Thiobacillus denitrificans ATCC 25259]|uniref:Uncharacterized protein n=1 Tax=Thiobacillus denitrificans (strain ATCC 25259 / T1) TaxID=292415 RepID=Q3SJ77_THIDA|nr:hypothetical protein Tbd_1337 [Thiobacillus denitrificans ATCC 25259]
MLFAITAAAEIVGCYLPWLVLRQDKLAWLLTPHPAATGLRLYHGGACEAHGRWDALIGVRLLDPAAHVKVKSCVDFG